MSLQPTKMLSEQEAATRSFDPCSVLFFFFDIMMPQVLYIFVDLHFICLKGALSETISYFHSVGVPFDKIPLLLFSKNDLL